MPARFEGEDLAKPERRRLQTEQTRSWLQQQMRERLRADEERRRAEDAYQAAMVARDLRACQLDRIEQDCRRRLHQTTEEYNRALVGLVGRTARAGRGGLVRPSGPSTASLTFSFKFPEKQKFCNLFKELIFCEKFSKGLYKLKKISKKSYRSELFLIFVPRLSVRLVL